MKRMIFTVAIATIGLSGYCQTASQKVVKTDTKVDSAQARLDRAKAEQLKATAAYIADAKKQIKANDDEIARLKDSMVKPLNSPQNDSTKKKIDELVERNSKLRFKVGM